MSASLESSSPPPFADARSLVLRTVESFRPPRRVSVADYAAAHRWVINAGGGYTGRWNHEETPYLVGPMEALTSRLYTTTCIVGPGQCGKTEVPHNWLMQSVCTDPADFLWYMQTDRVMRDHVKDRIDALIRDHPAVEERLGARPSDSTQEYKRFRGMSVHFLVAAQSNMISKKAPRIVVDELDNFDPSIRTNFITQIDVRRTTFGRESMVCAISHPDQATDLAETGWQNGIMSLYRRSTRATWWWPCPHCGAWSSPNPNAARVMSLHYPEDATLDTIRAEARLLCPTNGCLIEDHERRAMNAEALRHHGGWIHEGQTIDEAGVIEGAPIRSDVAGFWIVGAMSTLAMGGIGALAASRVEAQRAFDLAQDDDALRNLRDVCTKKWGIPYTPKRQAGELDAATIAERAEPQLLVNQVPAGVRFITAFADVQGNRFEVLVRGWGVDGESWIIAHDLIRADPTTSAPDWDALITRYIEAEYPLADGSSRGMRVKAFGYDSGGAPGTTQQAYAAWKRALANRLARRAGLISGREAWNLLPTKGLGTPNAPRLQVVRPDMQRKDRAAAAAGVVPLALFNANTFKDDLAGQLQHAAPGSLYIHFPASLRAPEPPHPFFEGLLAETNKNGVWKHESSTRNEPIDLMVGTHVMAHLHGLSRIEWERPPAWAAEWDRNSLVAPITRPLAVDGVAQAPAPAPRPANTPLAPTTIRRMISRIA